MPVPRTTLRFVRGIEAVEAIPPRGVEAPRIEDRIEDPLGVDDTFVGVSLGTELRFAIRLRNLTVPPATYDQFFRVTVQILGDGAVLDEVTIRIIVPMAFPDGGPPDAGSDGGPGAMGDGGPGAMGDAGPGDAGPGDAGPDDAGLGDAGPGDAGPGDAGPADAGPGDAGPEDAGPEDTGPDAG